MSAVEKTSPVDHAARQRIERGGLHETLFVDAGAGTGKTHELVQRIVHLVTEAGVPLSAIAAITFTEAAASELRDRVREYLERAAQSDIDVAAKAACAVALGEIDDAAIGTLHGFALRILKEHPLAIDLPPKVEILDEVSSQLAFEARWTRFVDELFADPGAEELVLRAWALKVEIDTASPLKASIKDVAGIFDDGWDRLDAVAMSPPPSLGTVDLSGVASALGALRAITTECKDPTDLLLEKIDTILDEAAAALVESSPRRQLMAVAAGCKGWKGQNGRAPNWVDRPAATAAANAVGEAGRAVVERAKDEVLRHLTYRLARFTRDSADDRRAQGRLDFHDLLVLARRLLRTSAEARAALHQRYQRLLLDEFQDTDPIQIELAVRIAAAVEDGGDGSEPWDRINAKPGRLFFVGDPKQSIYRFRRADISLFLKARARFSAGDPVALTQNFRTVGPILDWVNHVFDRLMPQEVSEAQPKYEPLTADRTDGPVDHRVVLLGGEQDGKAGELRLAEAAAVAGAIANVRDEPDQWQIYDTDTSTWRAPAMRDITILVPTRTSLRQLEDALDALDIPYRLATGTLVYDTREVREVLEALRAIDDPGDAIALVAALRSPLYACSDVDLFTFVDAGGRWDLRRSAPDGLPADHPVVAGIAHLHDLWRERWWHEPSALLDRLIRERQAFALAFTHKRPREVWRRLRFLVDQARAFEESAGGGLRDFVAWAELQQKEGTRVHEPLLAEPDDDAVSILTIHGAKGLEFPITVVSGTTTQLGSGRKGVTVLWDGDVPAIRLTADTVTKNFDRLRDIESEMDEYERIRLLYVACTRARDHLIVSTFHKPGKASYGAWLAEYSEEVEATLCRRLPDPPATAVGALAATPGDTVAPPAIVGGSDDREAWVARREALLDGSRQPRFLSATGIAALDPVEEGDEVADDAGGTGGTGADANDAAASGSPGAAIPWRRGRAGTAIGRAVHATLQFLGADTANDELLDALAAQHAHLEALPDAAGTIAALARSALRAPSVQAANGAARCWREIYVAAPLGDRAIEGYIDLLYEGPDGLVLIDYKTDSARAEADIDAKAEKYYIQAAAYALALEASTGLKVVAAHLVFCRPGEPVERTVPDLEAAKEEVRRRVAGDGVSL